MLWWANPKLQLSEHFKGRPSCHERRKAYRHKSRCHRSCRGRNDHSRLPRHDFPIELATGRSAYFLGKPNPLMMRTGLKLLGCHSADAAIIGDRMDTDIIGNSVGGGHRSCADRRFSMKTRRLFTVPPISAVRWATFWKTERLRA